MKFFKWLGILLGRVIGLIIFIPFFILLLLGIGCSIALMLGILSITLIVTIPFLIIATLFNPNLGG
jgi:hypothetical protein